MKKKKITFGILALSSFVIIFTVGSWIGGASKGETQCLPIKLENCHWRGFGGWCRVRCGDGYVLVDQTETYNIEILGTNMGICFGIPE